MGYRFCLGIQSLERKYGGERLELASKKAVGLGVRSYRHVATMLKNGLERELSDPEHLRRDNRKLSRLLRDAKLRIAGACLEDVRASAAQGLPKEVLLQLKSERWRSISMS